MMSFNDKLVVNPAYIDVKQREKSAMDAIERTSQVLRQGDVLPRWEAQVRGLVTNRDYLAGKLKFLSTAHSDDDQRAELQRGLDRVDLQLERYESQYNELVSEMNAANAERDEAAAELNACAAELVELSRRS